MQSWMRDAVVFTLAAALLPATAGHAQTSGVLHATVRVVDVERSRDSQERARSLLQRPPRRRGHPTDEAAPPVHIRIERRDRLQSARVTITFF